MGWGNEAKESHSRGPSNLQSAVEESNKAFRLDKAIDHSRVEEMVEVSRGKRPEQRVRRTR